MTANSNTIIIREPTIPPLPVEELLLPLDAAAGIMLKAPVNAATLTANPYFAILFLMLCSFPAYAFALIYSSMDAAAFLPAPIARITVAAPVTASPPAYTPSLVVCMVSSLTIRQPRLLASNPAVVVRISGFGEVPMDMITVSTSSTYSLPGMATGRRQPLSSG
mgnify:CR=1 FL=1